MLKTVPWQLLDVSDDILEEHIKEQHGIKLGPLLWTCPTSPNSHARLSMGRGKHTYSLQNTVRTVTQIHQAASCLLSRALVKQWRTYSRSSKVFRRTVQYEAKSYLKFQIEAEFSLAGLFCDYLHLNKMLWISQHRINFTKGKRNLHRVSTAQSRAERYFEQNIKESLNKSRESLLEWGLGATRSTGGSSYWQWRWLSQSKFYVSECLFPDTAWKLKSTPNSVPFRKRGEQKNNKMVTWC